VSIDLEAAWSDLHDAKPPGWFVSRPSYNERFREWEQYAFDPSERAQVGVRSRAWTAVAQSEVGVIRELARCLRLIRRGASAGVGAPGQLAAPPVLGGEQSARCEVGDESVAEAACQGVTS
jgi:hypothetical protein